jgi:hypothetical protein
MTTPRKLARKYGPNLLHLLFKTAASIRISLSEVLTPKLSPHLSKTRQPTVLARFQSQFIFIPSYSSRTVHFIYSLVGYFFRPVPTLAAAGATATLRRTNANEDEARGVCIS